MDIGDRKLSKRKMPPGYSVVRVVSGFCNPRNGNVARPTPIYRWESFHGDMLLGTSYKESTAVERCEEDYKEM